MKKIISALFIATLGLASVSAMACPKGSTLTGGTGKHHKGGTCSAKSASAAKTTAAAPAAAPAKK